MEPPPLFAQPHPMKASDAQVTAIERRFERAVFGIISWPPHTKGRTDTSSIPLPPGSSSLKPLSLAVGRTVPRPARDLGDDSPVANSRPNSVCVNCLRGFAQTDAGAVNAAAGSPATAR